MGTTAWRACPASPGMLEVEQRMEQLPRDLPKPIKKITDVMGFAMLYPSYGTHRSSHALSIRFTDTG